jgi:hypothetical protein
MPRAEGRVFAGTKADLVETAELGMEENKRAGIA